MPEFAATAGTSYPGSLMRSLSCRHNWSRLPGCKFNLFKWLQESYKPFGGYDAEVPGKGIFSNGVTLENCRNWLRLALSPRLLRRMATRKSTETAIQIRGFTAFSLVP